jgi:hypothetical protein
MQAEVTKWTVGKSKDMTSLTGPLAHLMGDVMTSYDVSSFFFPNHSCCQITICLLAKQQQTIKSTSKSTSKSKSKINPFVPIELLYCFIFCLALFFLCVSCIYAEMCIR